MTSLATADDWPQWRGPNRDARSTETGLLSEWPAGGPSVVWHSDEAGVGYSSLAVKDGRIITQGDLNGVEHILCFDERDGTVLWAVQPAPVAAALDERIDDQFAQIDRNRDGVLDPIETLSMGRGQWEKETESRGPAGAVAEARTAILMKALDANKDDKLSFDELPRNAARDLFERADRADPDVDADELSESRIATVLALDKDESGTISRDEARNTSIDGDFNRIDERLPGERRGDGELSKSELEKYFNSNRQRGRDGELSADELTTYFEQQLPNRDGEFTREDLKRMYGGYRNGQGDGPRGTPTIVGERVFVEGGNGDVTCLDAETGNTIWHVSLTEDFGGNRPGWGYSESPLVTDDLVIVTPGGRDGTLVALNADTGAAVWRTTDVTHSAHYSSAMAAYVAGTRQVIQFAREGVFGVSIEDGSRLWGYSGSANGTANCSTPVIDGDYILTASAYGTGGGLVEVTGGDSGQNAEEIYFEKALQNHHGGMVKVGDFVYATGSNTLICLNFQTGEIAWQSRAAGKGSVIYADGHLYCLGERNSVVLCEANPAEYVENGRFEIPQTGRPSWAHPVIANGRLLIRDQGRLTSYDIRSE